MKGWKIFTQSLRLVFANLQQALRISLLPFLLSSAALAWFLMSNARFMTASAPDSLSGFNGLPLLVFVVVGTVGYLWTAVAWHRFVLLREEASGWVPHFHGQRILGYMGRGLLLMLVLIIPTVVIGIVVGMLAISGSLGVIVAGTVLMTFALMVIFYRLSPVLPAVALGKPITMKDAWRQTRGAAGDIALLALISAVINAVLQAVGELGGNPGAPLAVVYVIVTGWLQFLVGLSILTTIYGHYVEGRSID